MGDFLIFFGFAILGVFAVLVFTVLLNPVFWQGWRNSKFLDEWNKEDDNTIQDIGYKKIEDKE